MTFLAAIVLNVSLFTFDGSNAWKRHEWREMFEETRDIYSKLGIKLRVAQRKHQTENRCKKYFKFKSVKTYGNCIFRRHIKVKASAQIALALVPPIPLCNRGATIDCTGVGGIAQGTCKIPGVASIFGKRTSTHTLQDDRNAGRTLTRVALQHEVGHILGAPHSEDYPNKKFDIMDSDALGLVADAWPDLNPPHYDFMNWRSRKFIKQCLRGSL